MSGIKVTRENPAIPLPTDLESTGIDDGSDNIEWPTGPGAGTGGGGSGEHDHDAIDVNYDNVESGLDALNVQDAIDELAALFNVSVDTLGSLTAGGSPQTVINDSTHNGFPAACRLDSERVLLVYPGDGTGHETGHSLCGQVGTLAATRDSVTWGTKFTILDDTEDLRCEGGAAVVVRSDLTRQLVIAYRYYTGVGGDNHDPSILICDDAPEDFTEASSWGSPIAVGLSAGSVQNYTQDRVRRLQGGTLLLPVGYDSGGTHTVGVWRWTGDVEDIASGAFVTVGSGATDYAEIDVEELPSGTLRAHVRNAAGTFHYKSESTDAGATWSALSSLYAADGFPMFRRLTSGLMLTVYRHTPLGDTAWRQATDDTDTTWGSETILDTTGDHSIYGNALQITPYKILVVYGVESSYPPGTDGDIYAQWFTDSSTFAASITSGIVIDDGVTTVDPTSAITFAGAGSATVDVTDDGGGAATVTVTVTSAGGIGEILISDTPSTPLIFADLIQNEAQDDLVYADP